MVEAAVGSLALEEAELSVFVEEAVESVEVPEEVPVVDAGDFVLEVVVPVGTATETVVALPLIVVSTNAAVGVLELEVEAAIKKIVSPRHISSNPS
jgi:hypothetical protein